MKYHSPSRLFLSLSVLALLSSGAGLACADDHDHDRGRHEQRDDRHDDHDKWHGERGAGPNHDMHRGERLPSNYRGHQYVVDDWRGHHLSAPPRGYHWVQVGGDYVLAAVATGVIMQLLLNN